MTQRFKTLTFFAAAISLLLATWLPIGAVSAEPTEAPACATFDDLAAGTSYNVGESIITNGVTMFVDPFTDSGGNPHFGTATVSASNDAGGSGNELFLGNTIIAYDFFLTMVPTFTVNVSSLGNESALGINGLVHHAPAFADFDGMTIDGVSVSVTGGTYNNPGLVELSGNIQSVFIGGDEVAIDNGCFAADETPPGECIDFNDTDPGSTFLVNDTFVSGGITVEMQPFFFEMGGTPFNDGILTIANTTDAGADAPELNFNNINASFLLNGHFPNGFSFLANDMGGLLNFDVNGELHVVEDFIDLDGLTIGGAVISIVAGGGQNEITEIHVSGTGINTFMIGGQELVIDQLCGLESAEPPDLAISKEYVGIKFVSGDQGKFEINVWNNGAGATTGNIVVSDTLPADLTYVTGGGNGWVCGNAGQLVTCTYGGVLQPAESTSFPIVVNVGYPSTIELTNCASVSTAGEENLEDNLSCSTVEVCYPIGTYTTGGTRDDWDPNSSDLPAIPSPGLVHAIQAGSAQSHVGYDDATIDRIFADTLVPQFSSDHVATSITLNIRLRGNFSPNTDTLQLGFYDQNGQRLAPSWIRSLSGWLEPVWSEGDTAELSLDLSALPNADGSTTDILELVKLYGFLDIIVEDETNVDYAELFIIQDCCSGSNTLVSGVIDNFSDSNGAEPLTPSPEQVNFGTYQAGNYDENPGEDGYLFTSFQNLRGDDDGLICGGILELMIHAHGDGVVEVAMYVDNDSVKWVPGLYEFSAGTVERVLINLNDLSQTVAGNTISSGDSITALMNHWNKLDISTIGAISIDYAILTVDYCCDQPDLGDAPASSNHSFGASGAPVFMTTYAPPVQANFPTVFDTFDPNEAHGPKHLLAKELAWFGRGVSAENDADLLPDQDGGTNIEPPTNGANDDAWDDGYNPANLILPECDVTTFDYDVYAKAAGEMYVNIWFDFNRDGDWEDSFTCTNTSGTITINEWAVQDQLLNLTPGMHTFTTPAFNSFGETGDNLWMRMTLAEMPAPLGDDEGTPDGRGPDFAYLHGETEDHVVTITGSEEPGCEVQNIGTLSGVVDDENTGAKLPGIEVTVFEFDGANWNPVAGATTDANGEYTMTLAAGSYRIALFDPSGAYLGEHYDNAPDLWSALDVIIDPCLETTIDHALTPAPEPEEPPIKILDGNAEIIYDPATDSYSIAVFQGEAFGDIAICMTITCDDGSTPTQVFFWVDGTSYPMTQSGTNPDQWLVTVPASALVGGATVSVSYYCDATPGTIPLGEIELFDPSGFITDANTGDPIKDATVTLYHVPGWRAATAPGDTGAMVCESNLSKPAGAPWSQAAPTGEGVLLSPSTGRFDPPVLQQTTSGDGYYGWDVAAGCWYVTVTAPGYEPLTSPVVGVPTEVTDLDLEMTPVEIPTSVALSTATTTPTHSLVAILTLLLLVVPTLRLVRKR